MEMMVNERLAHFLESRNMLASYQSGFHRGRGVMDQVLCLKDEIRKAQINKDVVVAGFFDIENAYDMGASFNALKSIYVMLIQSRVDYGCVVYGAVTTVAKTMCSSSGSRRNASAY